ncbi:hypothetical protein SAMN05428950_101578 [Sphingomonas sp. OV641]|nr:hypothetical protein SAMN05428950_101578 [Sphingomonas sp. OV641]
MPYHRAAVDPMTLAFTTPKTGTGGRTRTDNLLPEADFERPQMPYPLCIRGYPFSR